MHPQTRLRQSPHDSNRESTPEAFERLKPEARTPAARRTLQANLIGVEKKTMPYLLGVVNLLLHRIDRPALDERNTLTTPIGSIRDAGRVEVVATNPPFGADEEEGVLNNFPQGMRTKETATLFLQHIMAHLKRPGGRCGVVLWNGFLSGQKQVEIEVKKLLLQRFNLHTVVRLPKGVFEPYTDIATNVLFFESREGDELGWNTQHVWYYEHPLPEGREKTVPPRKSHWSSASSTLCWAGGTTGLKPIEAWKVPLQQLIDNSFNLDLKNPHTVSSLEQLPPEVLRAGIVEKEEKKRTIMTALDALFASGMKTVGGASREWPVVPLGRVLKHRSEFITIDDTTTYKRCRVQLHAQGVLLRDRIEGAAIKTKSQQVCRTGELLVAEIDAKHGGFGIVPPELDGAIVSSHYFLFEVDRNMLDIPFLGYVIRTTNFRRQVSAQGSTNYAAIRPTHVLSYTIPLPSLEEQRHIVSVQMHIEEYRLLNVIVARELDALQREHR